MRVREGGGDRVSDSRDEGDVSSVEEALMLSSLSLLVRSLDVCRLSTGATARPITAGTAGVDVNVNAAVVS